MNAVATNPMLMGMASSCCGIVDKPCVLETMGSFHDRSGQIGKVEVHRCRICGLGYSSPSIPDVSVLYADRESQDFQPRTDGLARAIKRLAFVRSARNLLKAQGPMPERVLDFGCGSGLFTRCLGDAAPDAEVIGCDFHSDPPAELRDRNYCAMDTLESMGDSFDLILAMHVLEHDDDPRQLLLRLERLLRPGGRLVMEVPNIDCVWVRVFGRAWDAWYMPYHRLHFSRQSLRALVQNAELKIRSDLDVCVPTMGRSIANVLRVRSGLAMLLLGALIHPLQLTLERVTGRASAIRLICTRF